MPVFLLMETTTRLCSVAVATEDSVLSEREELDPKGFRHAEALHPMISEVLQESGVRVRDLSGIGAAHGPGSYTGLRIGLAAAKGLAMPWDIPCYGVDSLSMLAVAVGESQSNALPIWTALDARRLEVYSAWFHANGHRQSNDLPEVADGSWMDRPPALAGGDGVEKVLEFWPSLTDSGVRYARARHAREAVALAHASGKSESIATWEPRYLKVFGQAL